MKKVGSQIGSILVYDGIGLHPNDHDGRVYRHWRYEEDWAIRIDRPFREAVEQRLRQ